MNATHQKIAAAFYSNARRVFVPCTVPDVVVRTGMDPDKAQKRMSEMKRAGLLTTTNTHNYMVYDLTKTGRDFSGAAQ